MSYSAGEHVENCKRSVLRAEMIAKHYPDARQEKIGGRWEWCDASALSKATGFSVEVVERKGDDLPHWQRFSVTLYPYHEMREGDVVARVYAREWLNEVREYEFMRRLGERPDLHGAILAMLKESR